VHSCSRVVLVLSLLAAPEAAQVTEERVRAAFEEARAAVEDALGNELEPVPPLDFVAPEDLARCVAEENLPLMRLREPDPEKATRAADLIGASALRAYAKYSWSEKRFLVVLESWNQRARWFDAIELTEDEAIRVVLVHELVHALDDAAYDLTACLLRCATEDGAAGFNAVLEGHAQHVARAVSTERGWSAGFGALAALVGAPPPSGLDEDTSHLLRMENASYASAYLDGERFVAALEAHDPELVARAFLDPPDRATVLHPEWFIDPPLPSTSRYDAEPALDQLAGRFRAEAWSARRVSLTTAHVSSAFALLPQASRRVTATLRSARSLSLRPVADPSAKMVVLTILEFDAPTSARAYLVAASELARIQDERMSTGVIRVLSSKSTQLDADCKGEYLEKRMKNRELEFDVVSIHIRNGPLVLETLFSGEPIEREAHVALAKQLLGSVRER